VARLTEWEGNIDAASLVLTIAMFGELGVEPRRKIVDVYKASRTFVTISEGRPIFELLLNIVISLCHLLLNCVSTGLETDGVANQLHNKVDGRAEHKGTNKYRSRSVQLQVPSHMYLWCGTHCFHSHGSKTMRKASPPRTQG
jgi:hypothetical protein